MNIRASKFFYFLIILLSFKSIAVAKTKVIGYLPSYQGIKTQIDELDLSKITHLTLAFLHPNKKGVFTDNNQPTCMLGKFNKLVGSSEIIYIVKKAHKSGVKVLVSIGGASYPICAGDWQKLLSNGKRNNTIEKLIKFIDDFNLDGLDVDLEGKLLIEIESKGYFLPFIQSIDKELNKRNKLLSAATGSYVGGMLPESSLSYFDYVSIMSYDAIGPTWGNPGVEHSTYLKAKSDIKLWRDKGLDKEKLILGLPFYGYGFGKYNKNYAFTEILNEFGSTMIEGDLIGQNCPNCSYISFNGSKTIKAKTELALQFGAGVMIWELSKDSADENSLLNSIDTIIKSK